MSVNKRKIGAAERLLPRAEAMLRGAHIVVGKGKRDFAVLKVRG